MCNYKTIYGEVNSSFVEKKSEFITNAKYVENQIDAENYITDIKNRYKDATHNCSCYIVDDKQLIKRYNDDGEPSRSAGLPMLTVLEKEKLKNVVVVATRYFGGIKLGKSGLIRAYTKSVSDISKYVIEKKKFIKLDITFDYSNLGIIDYYINNNNFYEIERNFTDKVNLKENVAS
ncbi:MAG: YigZ family protein, partial [Peptoniphilaceae bacterium]|nr:YigZ family protein [Peptoniphilaceae bacterium]